MGVGASARSPRLDSRFPLCPPDQGLQRFVPLLQRSTPSTEPSFSRRQHAYQRLCLFSVRRYKRSWSGAGGRDGCGRCGSPHDDGAPASYFAAYKDNEALRCPRLAQPEIAILKEYDEPETKCNHCDATFFRFTGSR